MWLLFDLNKQTSFIEKIYIIWYNGNNSEMKTDSVTAKDRRVINSNPLVDTKYENIWGYLGNFNCIKDVN